MGGPTTHARRAVRRALALGAGAVLAAALAVPPALADTETTEADADSVRIVRFAGADRFETAALFAQGVEADVAIVTTGRSFPDALAAAYLSRTANGPVLLTEQASLPDATRDAILALGVDTVLVVGGEAAVDPDVVAAIDAIDGVETVTRIAGADRFATAAAIARFDADGAGGTSPGDVVGEVDGQRTALLANGRVPADALAAGPTAAFAGLPLLLTEQDTLPQATADALTALGIEKVIVVGGPAAVDEGVVDAVEALDIDVMRVAGDNRYATAAAVADLNDDLGFTANQVGIARGDGTTNFADALALAALAGREGFSILLVTPSEIPADTAAALRKRADADATLVVAGGQQAVGASTAEAGAEAAFVDDTATGQTFTVTTTDDGGAGSLRQAIIDANASPGPDTIVLAADEVYSLTLEGRREDAGRTGDLDVRGDLVIEGNNSRIDGGGIDRVLEVLDADVTLRNVGITGGQTEDATDRNGFGGGIRVAGPTASLTMTGGEVSKNLASKAGGGIENAGAEVTLTDVVLGENEATGGDIADAANGGALHATGDTTVTGGSVVDNVAALEGGGLWVGGGATLTVDGTTFTGNVAAGDEADQGGGAIFGIGSTVVVSGATIGVADPQDPLGNQATGAAGSGGGILVDGGSLSVTGGTIDGNSAVRAGGGIEATNDATVELADVDMAENAAGAAPGNGGAVHLTGTASLVATGGLVMDNTAASEGGGFWNGAGTMEVTDTVFYRNVAEGDAADQGGGGLFNAGGDLTLTDVIVAENTALGASGSGGGILSDGGTLTVVASPAPAMGQGGVREQLGAVDADPNSIVDNVARRAGGGIEGTNGATIVLEGTFFRGNDVGTPAEDKIEGTPGNGGALHQTGDGDTTATDVEVTLNRAASEGGGFWNGTGEMTVTGSAIYQNTAFAVVQDDPATLGVDESAGQGGGGLFNAGGTLTVIESEIGLEGERGNLAPDFTGSGGGILNDGGTLVVTDSLVEYNKADRAGGGIESTGGDVTVTGGSLSNNSAQGGGEGAPGNGGGIHVGDGTSLLDMVTVSGNFAANEGGGTWNGADNMTILRSTVRNNTAFSGGGVYQALAGVDGRTFLRTSTVSGNGTYTAGEETGTGHGVVNDGVQVTLDSVTLVQPGVDAIVNNNATPFSVRIANTIVDGDCTGLVSSGADNVTTDADCIAEPNPEDVQGTDLAGFLDSNLRDNGGPTETHAVLVAEDSPLLDQGSAPGEGSPCLDTDQRGEVRPADGDGVGGAACDIGAFELQPGEFQ